MSSTPQEPALDPNGLLASLLFAPDRDRAPRATSVVSFRDDDEAEFLDELDRFATGRWSLERRGHWHGNWARLSASGESEGFPSSGLDFRRWHEARPILLPGLANLKGWEELLGQRRRLHDELKEPGGLRNFLRGQEEELEPEFRVHHRVPRSGQDPRDIERVTLHASSPSGTLQDLWAKSAWLSDREDDESLRLRLSFGREVHEDASRDLKRHLKVAELASRLFPETELVNDHPLLRETIPSFVAGPVFTTQHIAYWNAPGGGALFHHDAFDEPVEGGQRGVLYLQLTGRTAWLALSIEDLTRRVIEFGEYLAEGELGWVKARLFPDEEAFERFEKRCKRFKTMVKVLGRPGCGELGPLVNQGPEFTSLLADAGHGFVLEPGDAILLPNHGLERTAMHSVFCLGDEPGYAISMALRELEPPQPEPDPVVESKETPKLELDEREAYRRSRRRGGQRGRRGRRF